MLNKVLKNCKKMRSADVQVDVRQQEIKELITYKMYLQNLKSNVKQVYIFDLILVGIPSSLLLSIKNRDMWGICWTGKIC